MEDFDTLRENVADTASRLSLAQADRQARSEELFAMLGRLEHRFSTQRDQLVHYQLRIEPLEQANRALFGMVTGLLDIIEADIAVNQDDPLHNATEMVAKMLSRDIQPAPEAPAPEALSAEDPGVPAEEQAGEDGAAEEPEIRFDDVPQEVLDAELQAGAAADTAMPSEASDAEAEALAVSIGSLAAEAAAGEPAPVEEITAEDAGPEKTAPDPDQEPAEAENGDADEMEPLTVELDIPSPDADALMASEIESVVTDALDTISEAEDAAQRDPGTEMPDVRALLRRVEKAALKAQTLSQSRASTAEQPGAAAPEASSPPDSDRDGGDETGADKDTAAA